MTLVIVNARVRTGIRHRPWADAVAVAGGRLAAVGSSAEVRKLAPAGARVIDARGGTLLPAEGEELESRLEQLAEGTLAPGMLADFVLIDRELTQLAPEEIHSARIVLTVARGRVVHELPR